MKRRIKIDNCGKEKHRRRGRSSSTNHSTSSSSSGHSHRQRRSKSRRRRKGRKRDERNKSSRRRHRRRSFGNHDNSSTTSSSSSSLSSSTERKNLIKRRHRNYTDERNNIIDKHISIEKDKLESMMTKNGKYNKSAATAITKEDSGNLPISNNGIAIFNNDDDSSPPPNTTPNKQNPQSQATVRGPMTQCEYSKLQSTIREVIDPHSGRIRHVRGTGEIIERIVSREEHLRLNRNATVRDGNGFVRDIMRAASAAPCHP